MRFIFYSILFCSISLQFACKTKSVIAPKFDAGFYSELNSLPTQVKLEKLKAIIEENPHNGWALYWFGQASKEDTTFLINQYRSWMKQFPKVAEIPLALGNFYTEENNLKAKVYFQKAAKLDPQLKSAWKGLGTFEYFQSDFFASMRYLEKGVKANPEDAELFYRYAKSYRRLDTVMYKTLMIQMVDKFPKSDYAAQAMYTLALDASNPEEKIQYFEEIKHLYMPLKFRVASDAMNAYYTFLLGYDVEKTIPLLLDLLKPKFRSDDWGLLLIISNQILSAKKLIEQKNGQSALAILNNIKFPYFVHEPQNVVPLLRVQAIALSVNKYAAYDSLIVYFAKKPSMSIYKKILIYGSELNKDSGNVKSDVVNYLQAHAVKATGFKLRNYLSNDSLSLSQLKGNVVFLTYWFPRCGPCKAEFPHFENVLNRGKSLALKYVSINIVPKEEPLVLPMIQSLGYSFIPLEEKNYREKGNMDNKGLAPANFLIDKDGKLVFSDFRVDEFNEDDLKLMIELLIDRK